MPIDFLYVKFILWVMVGGLLVSQVLTLFTTPVIYLFFDRLFHRRRQADAAGAEPAR